MKSLFERWQKPKTLKEIKIRLALMWLGALLVLSCWIDYFTTELSDESRALLITATIFTIPFCLLASYGFHLQWKKLKEEK